MVERTGHTLEAFPPFIVVRNIFSPQTASFSKGIEGSCPPPIDCKMDRSYPQCNLTTCGAQACNLFEEPFLPPPDFTTS
eukprot:3827928-Karenia_brevis.AAC.1